MIKLIDHKRLDQYNQAEKKSNTEIAWLVLGYAFLVVVAYAFVVESITLLK
jgi:hypothetical protein